MPLLNSVEREESNSMTNQRVGSSLHWHGRFNREDDKEDAKPRLSEGVRKNSNIPALDDRVTHDAIHSHEEKYPIEKWLLNSSPIVDTRSTSTETVVDDKGFRPSQSYFRDNRPTDSQDQPLPAYTRVRKDLHRPHDYHPAHSNTSTETVIADNRLGNSESHDSFTYKERDCKMRQVEMNHIPQDRVVRSEQAMIKIRQEDADKIREAEKIKSQRVKDFSTSLRGESQKEPARTNHAKEKWPDMGRNQAIDKTFLSESPISYAYASKPRTAKNVLHRSYQEAKHRRFQSTGIDATNDRLSKPSGATHWAYTGLPISRPVRNAAGAFSDQTTSKQRLSAMKTDGRETLEKFARTRDLS
ncbi:MAG: hypothetical protein Q9165_000004 [Trypethelium subeluteriae]